MESSIPWGEKQIAKFDEIYFSSENGFCIGKDLTDTILSYLPLPDLNNFLKSSKMHSAFRYSNAMWFGQVKRLIPNFAFSFDMEIDFREILRNLCLKKQTPELREICANILVKGIDYDSNYAIRWASYYGYTEIVKLLLDKPKIDPSVDNNSAICRASYHGYTEIVKLLLAYPKVDPSVNHNFAIFRASETGRIEIVKLLLAHPKVNPSDTNNWAIRRASENGHTEIVKLLEQHGCQLEFT